MDMIARARQHFGNRATLMRTNLGSEMVLFHTALVPESAFQHRFEPPHLQHDARCSRAADECDNRYSF
jgi:hypothetical protein